jgi:hypothetical protein
MGLVAKLDRRLKLTAHKDTRTIQQIQRFAISAMVRRIVVAVSAKQNKPVDTTGKTWSLSAKALANIRGERN